MGTQEFAHELGQVCFQFLFSGKTRSAQWLGVEEREHTSARVYWAGG